MSYYRLYHLRHDHIVSFDEFDAAGDEAAIARSEELGRGLATELWCGKRRVVAGEVGAEHPAGQPSFA